MTPAVTGLTDWACLAAGTHAGMTVRTPAPLAAAVGLVAEAADQLRKLPSLLDAARERYDELALHGRDVLAGHRVSAPLVEPVEVGPVEMDVPDSVGAPPAAAQPVAGPVADRVADPVADRVAEPVTEPATRPPAPVPPLGRTEPVNVPDEVLDDVAQLTPGGELAHADLPLPDFDHQTVPQLRGRLRTLDLPELIQLRDYEQAHAGRLPVLTLLDNRIAKLTEGQ